MWFSRICQVHPWYGRVSSTRIDRSRHRADRHLQVGSNVALDKRVRTPKRHDIVTLSASGSRVSLPGHCEVAHSAAAVHDLVKRSARVARSDPWEYVGFLVSIKKRRFVWDLVDDLKPHECYDLHWVPQAQRGRRPDMAMAFIRYVPEYVTAGRGL